MIGPGFSRQRASALQKEGLRRFRDILTNGQFIQAEEAQARFGFKPEEIGAWNVAMRVLRQTW
jgi:hypothetical protein